MGCALRTEMAKIGMTPGRCLLCMRLGMWRFHRYGLGLITTPSMSTPSVVTLVTMGALYSALYSARQSSRARRQLLMTLIGPVWRLQGLGEGPHVVTVV